VSKFGQKQAIIVNLCPIDAPTYRDLSLRSLLYECVALSTYQLIEKGILCVPLSFHRYSTLIANNRKK